MSEWNRRDRDDDRRAYRYGDRNRREVSSERSEPWRDEDESRSFGERGGLSYERSAEDYQTGGRYGGEVSARARQAYAGAATRGDYRRPDRDEGYQDYGGQGYRGHGGYYGQQDQDDRQQYGDRWYGRPSPGRQFGARQDDREGGGVGDNERLQRVSDGDFDRGHFFGGGMSRGEGEHRGRGPKNYRRSDERIRDDVNDRLSDDSWLDASEIEVQVAACEVTLSGTVNSREDKRRAEDIAEQVSGVKHVQNSLRIQPSSPPQSTLTPSTGAGSMTGRAGQTGSTAMVGRRAGEVQ